MDNCIKCGKPITDWEEVEQRETELVLTYKCSCGFYGEQYYDLIYRETVEVK